MPENSFTQSAVSTCLLYRDAQGAIEWLCRVFGFAKHALYQGADGSILHSELTLGGGMIMVGARDNSTAYRKLIKHPDETGGAEIMSINLVVTDADKTYAVAKENGAVILLDIEDKHYGGRGFTCSDPEGYIWNIGTYNPWQPK